MEIITASNSGMMGFHFGRVPNILAAEIADDLEVALEQFTKIAARLAQRL
jgi:hypothetical protein